QGPTGHGSQPGGHVEGAPGPDLERWIVQAVGALGIACAWPVDGRWTARGWPPPRPGRLGSCGQTVGAPPQAFPSLKGRHDGPQGTYPHRPQRLLMLLRPTKSDG